MKSVLRIREFIELICQNKRTEAENHASKYISTSEETHEVSRFMISALLNCPMDFAETYPYKKWFDIGNI